MGHEAKSKEPGGSGQPEDRDRRSEVRQQTTVVFYPMLHAPCLLLTY
jgi:hypothetical protein